MSRSTTRGKVVRVVLKGSSLRTAVRDERSASWCGQRDVVNLISLCCSNVAAGSRTAEPYFVPVLEPMVRLMGCF